MNTPSPSLSAHPLDIPSRATVTHAASTSGSARAACATACPD
jgi:hypothetical protein